MSAIICPSCKSSAPSGALFCDNCGYDLRTVPTIDEEKAAPTYLVPSAGTGEIVCPNCRHSNVMGSVFCENCGTQLPQQPVAPRPTQVPAPKPAPSAFEQSSSPVSPTPTPPPAPKQETALDYIPGRLLIMGENLSLPIPPGKNVISLGREDPVSGIFPDIDLDPHGGHESGVGRRHAQLILRDGEVMIEDLDSVNGTVVNKLRLKPNAPQPIKHGDEIRLGKMIIIYMAN